MKKNRLVSPKLWLMTDPRIDDQPLKTIRNMPRGSAMIFRHYHLDTAEREMLFIKVRRAARRRGHLVLVAGSHSLARKWKADGVHNNIDRLSKLNGLIKSAAVHSVKEALSARARNATFILISPVFPTASHVGGKTLGLTEFRSIAEVSQNHAVALGGIDRKRAIRLKKIYPKLAGWAAIDSIAGQYG